MDNPRAIFRLDIISLETATTFGNWHEFIICYFLSKRNLSSYVQELAAAVVEERFADATRLRDASHSSLEGWWVARGEDDPCGKLVHIKSNYSYYIGREYSTSDIAEAHGWTDDVSGGPQLSNPDERLENMGRGALEVYLRKNEDGNVEHQACVLKVKNSVGFCCRIAWNI